MPQGLEQRRRKGLQAKEQRGPLEAGSPRNGVSLRPARQRLDFSTSNSRPIR